MRRLTIWTGIAGMLVLAACGGGTSSNGTARTTSTTAGTPTTVSADHTRVIGGCRIEPKASCAGANLRGADLHQVDLSGADLQRVDLGGANLSKATLRGADLTNALITNADLAHADLANTRLKNANLTGSNLFNANFRGAVTSRPDLFAATFRCHTTAPNGSIDNTSCSKPAPTAPPPTTTQPKPVPPSSRPPTTPPTTPPSTSPQPPPCTVTTLEAAYTAKFGPPPDGTTFAITACTGGYAGTNLANPDIGPTFAVYQAHGSAWLALSVGTEDVCAGLGIPPAVEQEIGCV